MWATFATRTIFLLAASVALACSGGESDDSSSRLANAYDVFFQEYAIPIAEAVAESDSLCRYVDPETGSDSCSELVSVLDERNAYLRRAIDEFTAIYTNHPAREDLTVFGEMIGYLEDLFALNQETVSAWTRKDDTAWRTSWAERDQLDSDVQIALENLEAN